jgi:hypothetical protein
MLLHSRLIPLKTVIGTEIKIRTRMSLWKRLEGLLG